jgi:hypothetical protein
MPQPLNEKPAVPHIALKDDHSDGSAALRRLCELYSSRSDDFFDGYHKRSNVESAMRMLASKVSK